MNDYWKEVYRKSSIRYILHRKVIKRCNGKCADCGTSKFINGFEIHHIKPRCLGGKDIESNLTMLCKECHRVRHLGTKDSWI